MNIDLSLKNLVARAEKVRRQAQHSRIERMNHADLEKSFVPSEKDAIAITAIRINGRLVLLTSENFTIDDDGTISLKVEPECAICPVFSKE